MYYRNTKINTKDRIEYLQYMKNLKPKTEVDTAIHFDSVFRNDQYSNADDFTITLPSSLRNVVAISLSSCRFPNVANLINNFRHSFSWSKQNQPDATLSVNLSHGQYTITSLLNALITEMNRSDASSLYIYTLDTSNSQLEIQSWGSKNTCPLDPFQYHPGDTFLTVTTTLPHRLVVNQNVLIQGAVSQNGPWANLNVNWIVQTIVDDFHFTIQSNAISTFFTSSNVTGGGNQVYVYIEQPIKLVDTPTSIMRSLGFPAHNSGISLTSCQLLRLRVLKSERNSRWIGNIEDITGSTHTVFPVQLGIDSKLPFLAIAVSELDQQFEVEISKFELIQNENGSKYYGINFARPFCSTAVNITDVYLPFVLATMDNGTPSPSGMTKNTVYQLTADYTPNKSFAVTFLKESENNVVWFQALEIQTWLKKRFRSINDFTVCGPDIGFTPRLINDTNKYVTALINDLYVHVCAPDLNVVNQINCDTQQKSGLTQTNNVLAAIKLDSNPDSFIFVDQAASWLYFKRNPGKSLPTLENIRLTLKSPRNESMNLKNMNYSGILTIRQSLVL